MNCCDDYGKCTQDQNCPVRCTQDCNQGRNCTCAQRTDQMSFGWVFFFMLLFALLIAGLFRHYTQTETPNDALDHANKYCQALYGPQTGAIWDDHLKCQTVRGEILPAKQP